MIGTALLFCALFTIRTLVTGDSMLGGVFAAITVGLAIYFRWFLRTKAEALVKELPSGE
jgi:hypothetical protein